MDKKTAAIMIIAFFLTIFVCVAAFNTAKDMQVRRLRQTRRIKEVISDISNREKIN